MGRGGVACPKPEPRKRTKAHKQRQARTKHHDIHEYVFMRERNICRCCRCREAHSMHELVFRSQGGKVSKTNSIAVCGSGTTLCHGFLQAHAIKWIEQGPERAEGTLQFLPATDRSAEHMKLKRGESIISPPMRDSDFDAREMA